MGFQCVAGVCYFLLLSCENCCSCVLMDDEEVICGFWGDAVLRPMLVGAKIWEGVIAVAAGGAAFMMVTTKPKKAYRPMTMIDRL